MWVICKFGGTSVQNLARWQTIRSVAAAHVAAGHKVLLVLSAVSGISDLLEVLLREAESGHPKSSVAEIRRRHVLLAKELGVSAEVCDPLLLELERLVLGVALTGEVTPRTRARVLSAGELLSTRLGAAWLERMGTIEAGFDISWLDARTVLTTTPQLGTSESQRFLSAHCEATRDEGLAVRLEALRTSVVLTQGFIATDPEGRTVLLGRGGSDTSATLFAARLGAEWCEIWTDVRGMYSADPRLVPSARLLTHLEYEEAQEIASTGAKVLHPRCISPARAHGIPIHIRCTTAPEASGTIIGRAATQSEAAPTVKAISARKGIVLVSMETMGMWQQVGFLADAFACFKTHGLSVDLVSTSETNVTVSLDPSANTVADDVLGALVKDLLALCEPTVIRKCAAVSIVGRQIRAILHQLAPVLELFEAHRIHLLSQAASDLNFTVVVDEDQAERLVRQLHSLLFASPAADAAQSVVPDTVQRPWWWGRRDELLALACERGPLYAYDGATIDAAAKALTALTSVDRVFYAMKANSHPEVLRRIDAAGVGFECVSPGELERVQSLFGRRPSDWERPAGTLFTPNFAARAEYELAYDLGAWVTLDNLHPLEHWPEVFRDRGVVLRLDPGHGRGHHAHVRTGGAQSKFGVSGDQLDRLQQLLGAVGARVVALHAHAGSGIRDPENWEETARFLAGLLERFPDAGAVDVGGGLGVVEKPGQWPLDLAALDASLGGVKDTLGGREIWLEPGRFLVASAGVLLARVTQLKRKGDVRFLGIETGMNSLIRPALYGAFHQIVNLTRLDEAPIVEYNVVGPICESGDTLGYARRLPESQEGDVLLIGTAGAYGRVMSSDYNLRPPAAELVL